jgi:hypothetical protein
VICHAALDLRVDDEWRWVSCRKMGLGRRRPRAACPSPRRNHDTLPRPFVGMAPGPRTSAPSTLGLLLAYPLYDWPFAWHSTEMYGLRWCDLSKHAPLDGHLFGDTDYDLDDRWPTTEQHERSNCRSRARLDLPLVTGRFTAVTGLTGLDRLRYWPVTNR